MKIKTKNIGIGLGCLVLVASGLFAAHTYLCQFGGQCTYKGYGIVLRYPSSWKIKKSGNTGVVIARPKGRAPLGVGFLPKVSGSQGIVGATNTEMLVSSQPLPNMPGARDVRIIAESRDSYGDTFTPFEAVVSSDSYHQLGLVQGKMMPMANYVPSVTVAGRKVLIGSFDQDPTISSIAAAREWFMTADATKVHQILLMVKSAAK